jgi:hypothetical protein
MISKIILNFECYKNIYNNILPELDRKEEQANTLLENSLYLSLFTSFENFLKKMIDNYNNNKLAEGIKFCDLDKDIAHIMVKQKEKNILNMFSRGKNSDKSYEYCYKIFNEPLSKEDLNTYIHFDYLHANKLDNYYSKLFRQLLGEDDFLKNLKLVEKNNDLDTNLMQEINENAFGFIKNYTNDIRNNIAHNNSGFIINSNYSFNKVADNFIFIMTQMKMKYEKNTGYNLNIKTENNIMDNF